VLCQAFQSESLLMELHPPLSYLAIDKRVTFKGYSRRHCRPELRHVGGSDVHPTVTTSNHTGQLPPPSFHCHPARPHFLLVVRRYTSVAPYPGIFNTLVFHWPSWSGPPSRRNAQNETASRPSPHALSESYSCGSTGATPEDQRLAIASRVIKTKQQEGS
jgi:hypothetical protein